ncbi:PEP-CTERM sorting domain-containing protein [Pontiella sulfatireligans]|uniref:PEP-CTERM protein-sorting domain-containing protein n=1 Tax=Pontiella sulfatireligans TaxID=2750658 RepID=A0A6C2UU75_9BACT|nr:PEP-CTERM sorting domain-containing protein [Pontiella sulfatireligans]VGO22891.1 hypothetical protein SCARR_04988 [Pontiella sulfatireligans]
MKKSSIRFLITLLVTGSISASAQTGFTDGGGDHLWSNPANWSAGLPDAADAVTQTASGGALLNLDSDAGTVASFNNGNNSTSTFNIVSGGSLTTGGRFDIANSDGVGVGILNVDGGSLSVGGDFQLGRFGTRSGIVTLNTGSITASGQTQIGGWNTGTGDLTINGGTYTANERVRVGVTGAGALTMNAGTLDLTGQWGPGTLEVGNGAGDGLFVLNGGTVSVDLFSMDDTAAGSARAEINGGLLQIRNKWSDDAFTVANDDAEFFIGNGVVERDGDSISLFTSAVDAGNITWDSSSTTMLTENWDVSYTNGTGSILFVDYNDATAGSTTMWAAIPEPATLGLVAAMGGIMLMVRRAFML